jgi:hypothetical protein
MRPQPTASLSITPRPRPLFPAQLLLSPLPASSPQVHHEHYEYFPDDGTGDLGPVYHGYMAGDTRAAMAPFLAHQ